MTPRIYVDSIETLETTLHELIPISQAMGIKVQNYNGTELTLAAPLSNNINHQHSAFGGSLFAVAVLAGWGLMQLKLSELMIDCNTVVMGAEVTYERPVYDDLICSCSLPDDAESLFKTLEQDGVVATQMTSSYRSHDKLAMQLLGKYHLKRRD